MSEADEKNDELRSKLEQAYAAGRIAGLAEQGPPLRYFSNGSTRLDTDPGREDYEDALRSKVFELRGRGIRNVKDHDEILEIKTRFGRV